MSLIVHITHAPPRFSEDDAVALASRLYALDATATPLPSERDRNFLLTAPDGERFVLKIANATDDEQVLDLQTQALRHLAHRAPGLRLPRVHATRGGELLATAVNADGQSHVVRLLTYVPGAVMAEVRPHSEALLTSLGRVLGTLDAALLDFSHPAADRPLKWDIRRAAWIRDYLSSVDGDRRRAIVARNLDLFERDVVPRLPSLRSSVIYNDANDYNVIVGGDDPYARHVVAVVDYGDMLRSCTVAEVAVASAYAMLDKPDPIRAAMAIVRGYHAEFPLRDDELEVLFPLIRARLAVSVVNSAVQRHAEPGNEYLTISERPAWELLERLDQVSPRLAHYSFRAACGLAANPASPRVIRWLETHGDTCGPLLDPDPRSVATRVLDLSVGSSEAGTPALWSDPVRFARVIRDRVLDAGAGVGIGRYDEARAVYASDLFRSEGNDGAAWRSVHIGLDLFVDAGAEVLAPLDGVVHSVANNAGPLDYGPTIVLEHPATVDRPAFFTLYGHLALASLDGLGREQVMTPGARPATPRPIDSLRPGLRQGQVITRGTRLGWIGDHSVNGGWPPHLHFQVITDVLDRRGDFPGVVRPEDRDVWLSLCPDPNLITRIPAQCTAPRGTTTATLLHSRARHLGPSLSVSYRRPLKIVRGWMQHLYDEHGRAYLDAVNNVPHVGHSHPRVVDAGQQQMNVLNTNTRYLHDLIGQYAERLCGRLPDPLSVCFFVNSGSEANELALRLARAATGSRNTIVVDVAYHGNTTTLVDISPYKFNGPGGAGPAAHVRTVPTPDVFRGRYRGDAPDLGVRYAAHLDEAIHAFQSRGERVGAFIAESILSCAGQIVLPDGYLRDAYRRVRQAGGVCIADEVQVGFGRVGTHAWAFETQDVVPDIVTLGKPIGNGHPLGAVVTTAEIARSFANGMEYFNTFGGNPVSCAIGIAVLDVIEDEGLQRHAKVVGSRLLNGLRGLVDRHPIVGDVRGLGLFVGIELVRDRSTLEPADREASYVSNRLRDRGVLVSTDGPFHNVIKIKPPLVFDGCNADMLVDNMDTVLGEL